MPTLPVEGLRPAQVTAIHGLERSVAEQQYSRSLVQMATGAGKTFTAVTESYRLLKYGGFHRILFLVDRNNLGDQTLREFRDYTTPDDGRKLTELYNVDKLTGAGMVGSSKVVISTIQRVFKVLSGEDVPDVDDPVLDGAAPEAPVTVTYSADLPPEAFDLIIVDECHRSIYGSWRGVLEYFDAHITGLTATPVKQTFGFFQQNLVSEYTYAESVADGVNVDFDVYRIKTQITDRGSTVEAGTIVPKRDRRTRQIRYVALDEDLVYAGTQLERAVTAPDQIRTVLETFRDRLFTEIFPGRSTVPKTLIFAKDDAHAEEVVTQIRQVFGKGNDFAAKITYSAKDPKGSLQAFRNSPTLRVAVTVDMIATGTDVKPLECVFFLRDIRSASYFEQMKGRGARTIPDTDFQVVTPDAPAKTRFVLVDAVGSPSTTTSTPRRSTATGPSRSSACSRRPRRSPSPRPRSPPWPPASRGSTVSSTTRNATSSPLSPARSSRTSPSGSSPPSTRTCSPRSPTCANTSTRPSGRSLPILSCATGCWRSVVRTTSSSTRPARTTCSMRTAWSTPTGPGSSSPAGAPTSRSTATRSAPSRCFTRLAAESPSPSSRSWPTASSARPTAGRPT